MKFSIVITTYNRLSVLKRAIESALAQTEACEVIVVDNGSTDGTDAYLQTLAKKLTVWRNPVNLGHSKAINIGVELARGDWIKPLDDDDYLAPNCVAEMLRAIKLHPPAVICSCQAFIVDSKAREISQTTTLGTAKVFYIPQEDIQYGMLLEQVRFGTTSQVAFAKNAFLKSGGWDLSLDVCDEIDSWLRIAQFGDAIFINCCLAYRSVWLGGYNRQSSLQKRYKINLLMKEKIYSLVNQKYQSIIPSPQDIRNYLKLHWLIIAMKEKNFFTFFAVLFLWFPAILSVGAWKLLLDAILFRAYGKLKTFKVRQITLVRHDKLN